jgi:hypothetical protein
MTSTRVIGGTDYNYINALTDVFYYKKSLISYIIAYIVISKAFNIFGTNGGVISLIIVLLIYFKILKIPLFNSPELDPSKFGDLYDYIMAEKSCGPVSTLNNNKPSKTKKSKKTNVDQETNNNETTPVNNNETTPENNTETTTENNTETTPEIPTDIKEPDLNNSESSNVDLVPITSNISNMESENNPKIEFVVETPSQIESVVEAPSPIESVVESPIESVVESPIETVTTSKSEPTSIENATVLPNSLI